MADQFLILISSTGLFMELLISNENHSVCMWQIWSHIILFCIDDIKASSCGISEIYIPAITYLG